MPVKLIPPGKRSPNWRARGTHDARTRFAVYVNESLGTRSEQEARKLFRLLVDRLNSDRQAPASKRDFAAAAYDYMNAGGETRFIEPLLLHFKSTPIDRIDQAAIDSAALALYPDVAAATRNRQVYTPVSAILRGEGINVALRRPKGSHGASRLHWLSPEQLFALLDAADADDARFGALLTFLAYCGPRLSEALRLEWADVDPSASHAFLRETKNGEAQSVHLPPVVVAAFAKLPRDAKKPRVFGLTKTGRLYKQFARVEANSGVTVPDGVSFHIFRHTYGAWMRRYGGLDTSGLLATKRWKARQSASVYEHADTTEEARRADLLPTRK